MTKRIANIVVGLGKTGFSCVRYLAEQGADFMVVDTREQPPYLAQLQQQYPDVAVQLGDLDAGSLSHYGTRIRSDVGRGVATW